MKNDDWAIIGGGLLGMTLAWSLAKQGRKVTLFEAAPELGGLASAWKIGDIVWDRHYHVTLYSDQALRALLKELELEAQMCWRQAKTAMYHDGRVYPFSNPLDYARFPLLNPIEKLRLAATVFHASRLRHWEPLQSVSIEDWLTRLSGASVFRKVWLPLLRCKLGDEYRTTSATFIWATIQRMYAASRAGIKQELFGYLPGGYARMLRVFETALERSGIDIHLKAVVQRVVKCDAGGLEIATREGSRCFSQVIVTTPAPVAARLCPGLNEEEKRALAGTSYLGILCASALVRRGLSRFYITNILDSTIPLTGLIEMSALVDPAEFANQHLLYLPHYLLPSHPDFSKTDDELRSSIIESLKRMYPSFKEDDLVAFKISRVPHVFPRPLADPNWRQLPRSTSVSGLHLLNSAHIVNGTLNANETITLAQNEAKRLHAIAN